jgi:cytochrome c peroxidase
MYVVFFLLIIPFVSHAQTSPDLDRYIQMMKMRPLPSPAPKNEALYQLGLRLFYDKQLSGKENISCHSCHALSGYSGDTLPLAVGEGADGLAEKRIQNQGVLIPRHTPALYNLGTVGVDSLFWDGRIMRHQNGGWWTPEEGLNGPSPKLKEIASTLDSLLAAQALFPIASPEEMLGQGSSLTRVQAWEQVMKRLLNGRLGASYQRFFSEAFPGVTKFNIGHVGNALAELERHHFVADNTLWDQYLRGNKEAMTERMKRGALLFLNKGACTNCHSGEHLTTFGFSNIGIPQIGPGVSSGDDKGRAEFTKVNTQNYRFRIAPLRNIGLTAPYMHSGAFSTLWEVIDHYDHPMHSLRMFNWDPKHPNYREDLKHDDRLVTNNERAKLLANNLPRNIGFTLDEKTDLFCFLAVALTDQKLQGDLITKGIAHEISDCSPRISTKSERSGTGSGKTGPRF